MSQSPPEAFGLDPDPVLPGKLASSLDSLLWSDQGTAEAKQITYLI
jgi:hypothetical protein